MSRDRFGIRVPVNMADAIKLDEANGNRLWQEAIDSELESKMAFFEVLCRGEDVPLAHQLTRCDMIFSVKMGSLKRKARLVVVEGVTGDVPSTLQSVPEVPVSQASSI